MTHHDYYAPEADFDDAGLLDLAGWRKDWPAAKWREQFREPDDDALAVQLRRCTHTGRPLATDNLLSKLERKLGRRLRPLPVGRPKKKQKPERHKKRCLSECVRSGWGDAS